MNKPYDRPLRGNRCQCQGCYEYFNSLSGFERHRVGNWKDDGKNRRCLTPDEMRSKGWLLNEAGFWITAKRPASASTTSEGAEISPNG